MEVSAVTTNRLTTAYAPPVQQQQQQQPRAPQNAPSADTVAISKRAQQLASDGDTQAKEVRESGAEKAGEIARGKA